MNKIIIITGGTSGLGKALVQESLKRGYYVCNLSRNQEKMNCLDLEFSTNYKGFTGDITDYEFVKKSIMQINQLGEIYCLINCAEKGFFKPATEYEESDIDMSFMGLKGMILCTKEALRAKKEKDLKIVNIMSSAALKGNKNETIYCAAKWGERGYTEALKAEYKGTSVKIIGVYPGGMNTEFWNNSRNYVNEEKSKTFMNPSDVAEVILDNISYNSLNVSDIIIERTT